VGTSTNGARVLITGSYIFYGPSTNANSNADDYFDYRISDGFVGGTATNKILIHVVDPNGGGQSANLTGISVVTNGIQVTFVGIPGYTYHVQRAPTPTGPWTDLGTATANNIGQGVFTDTDPPQDQGYYRTSWP
jgi:hypothetical protein